jgi:hypothetical protein
MTTARYGYDQAGLYAAAQQMRLVLMGTGAMTLEQVNRHAPGLTRAVVGAYLQQVAALDCKSQPNRERVPPMMDDGLGDGVDPRVVEAKAEIAAAQQEVNAALADIREMNTALAEIREMRAYATRMSLVTGGFTLTIAVGILVQPSSRALAIGIWVGSLIVWFVALLVRRPKAARA